MHHSYRAHIRPALSVVTCDHTLGEQWYNPHICMLYFIHNTSIQFNHWMKAGDESLFEYQIK